MLNDEELVVTDEKLIYVHSDMLLHEEQWNVLRKKVLELLKDNQIRNCMYFKYSSDTKLYPDKIQVITLMACTETTDFFQHPTEIIKDIRKRDFILMNFKTLKQFLSL